MKNIKYIPSYGVAFYEENEMQRLNNYAKKGWLLEGNAFGGLFYKLRKDKPQDLQYSLDYQENPDEDYFKIFSEAGWTKVVSIKNYIHIFSSKTGTAPIYIDTNSETEKYLRMKNLTKTGVIYSLSAMIISLLLLLLSNMYFANLNKVFKILFIICTCFSTLFLTTFTSYNIRSHSKTDKSSNTFKYLFLALYLGSLAVGYFNSVLGASLLFLIFLIQSVYIDQRKKK